MVGDCGVLMGDVWKGCNVDGLLVEVRDLWLYCNVDN